MSLRSNWMFAGAVMCAMVAGQGYAADTIKVGVLHSLTGTMAISETALKDTVLMLIEEQNAKGGLLGRKLEAVVKDPGSDWPTYGKMAQEMLTKDKVSVIFGCWTSVSRKNVVPVVEEQDGLLFYPVQYEGQEQSENVYYTGATPNQQAIPAVQYLLDKGVTKFHLLGTDYVYPRTTNRILQAFLSKKGIAEGDVVVNYTPFGNKEWKDQVAEVKKSAASGKKTAVVSTINGDANITFYNELTAQGINPADVPVVAFSVGEGELQQINPKPLVGHLTAWNYFMSVPGAENEAFIKQWQTYSKNLKAVTNDPMEATLVGFRMWSMAVDKAKDTGVDKVRDALKGLKYKAPSGFELTMDNENHHLHKPVMIGSIQENGQMSVVWKTQELVPPSPWSPYIAK